MRKIIALGLCAVCMLSGVLVTYGMFSLTLRINGMGMFLVPKEDSVVIPSQVQTHAIDNNTLAISFNLTNKANYDVFNVECYVYFYNSTGGIIALANVYLDRLNAFEMRHYYLQASADNLMNFDSEWLSIDYLR